MATLEAPRQPTAAIVPMHIMPEQQRILDSSGKDLDYHDLVEMLVTIEGQEAPKPNASRSTHREETIIFTHHHVCRIGPGGTGPGGAGLPT